MTLVKDLRRIPTNRTFGRALEREVRPDCSVPYVFQLHGLFWDAGLRLARAVHSPSVLVVDACQVEEARSWGIRRRGYGQLAERWGERPQLRDADLVVCVSDEVADQVARVTGRRRGVIVVPNGVDTDHFAPGPPDAALRESLGLGDAFVVGWTGSFRSFHGLDTLLEAAALAAENVPRLTLLLVGDGLGRPGVETRARELGVATVLPGTVGFDSMPRYLRLMDVAVALAPGREFHYSPVKVREYQACGIPVIAAAAGEMARSLTTTAQLVAPGDASALARAIESLATGPDRRSELGEGGRASVVASGSWANRLDLVERELGRT